MTEPFDYVIYIDTDSLFINIYQMLVDNGAQEAFESLNEDEKIEYISKVAGIIQDYVNEESFNITQCLDYNSQEVAHKVSFKSEVVASSGLFVKKKKYMIYCVFEDGYKPKTNLKVTGLELIRSVTPRVIKPMLKDVMTTLLTAENKSDTIDIVKKYKEELRNSSPETIAENIAVHDLNAYIDSENRCKKGTPRHTKGVAAYRTITKYLNIEGKAPNIESEDKVKVVYLKNNRFNVESLSFIRWMDEFDECGLEVDYDKMIYNNFVKKIEQLLEIADVDLSLLEENLLSEWF